MSFERMNIWVHVVCLALRSYFVHINLVWEHFKALFLILYFFYCQKMGK